MHRASVRPRAARRREERRGVGLLLQGLLQPRAGRELRDPRGRDLDGLAGARVHALARAALGDAELPEAREIHLAAAPEGVLDRVQYSVNGLGRIALRKTRRGSDLVDELGLRHSLSSLNSLGRRATLTVPFAARVPLGPRISLFPDFRAYWRASWRISWTRRPLAAGRAATMGARVALAHR